MKRIMLVGGGHRAAFYLRVAKALPEEFLFTSAYVHDPAKAAHFEATWGIKPYTDFDRLLAYEKADFDRHHRARLRDGVHQKALRGEHSHPL